MPVDHLLALVATGQYLAAYREVERLSLDPDLDPSVKAKVFIVGVRAAAGIREIHAAVKMAEKAVECAELGSNWEDIGNARLYSALIYRELGDTVQALRFFRLFLEYLDRYPSLQSKTAHAYYNMALTYQQRREYDEALATYKLSMEDFESLGTKSGVLACLQNCAWVWLLQGRPHQAEALLEEAQALSTELEVPEYQMTQLVIESLHAKLTGQTDRAMALCEEVFQPGRSGVTERHLAEASWIMAGLTLELGRVHEAGIFAELAVSHALQTKDPHLMNLAGEVRKRTVRQRTIEEPGA